MILVREFRESIRIAIDAIRVNKARGALTTLGIIIGIVAVITTMTAANGLQNTFRQGFSAVGSDVLYVSRMPWVMMDDFFIFRNRPDIELREAAELDQLLRGQAIVNPSMDTGRDIRYRGETMSDVRIVGTTEKHALVSTTSAEHGRFFLPYDVTYKKKVCVIGTDVREAVFGGTDPINKTIHIGRTPFRVIGVMEEQGGSTFGGPNFDRQVFMPIGSFIKAFGGRRQGVDIAIKASSPEVLDDLEYEVTGAMRQVRQLRPTEDENFAINRLDTLVGAFNNIMGVVLLVGLLVTSVSLFVGGVGVMNIMFVSVTERTREIGIRKAIGAKRRTILMQFLFESASICLLGGLIGIGLAAIVTAVIDKLVMPAQVSVPILVIAVLISMTVGVIAGFVPAFRGARLDPIEALRYE